MRQSPLRVRRLGFSQVEPLVVIAIIGTLVGLRSLAVVGVVLTAAVMRLVPHPPNVTPMFALALFGGAYFGSRIVSIVVPLAAMLLSNIVLGLTSGGNPFPFMPFVYISFVLTVLLGWWVRRRHCSVVATLSATLVSAVLFFAISNFGVWLEGDLYPRTLPGLAECYVAAIPFFRNSLAGDAIFTTVLFGSFGVAERYLASLREPVCTPKQGSCELACQSVTRGPTCR